MVVIVLLGRYRNYSDWMEDTKYAIAEEWLRFADDQEKYLVGKIYFR